MPTETSYVGQRKKRLILLEFNELCPTFVDNFIDEGLLPNFKRLREESRQFITHTTEAVLEPWVQWVTVHTGVPLSEHGILDLDEADKLKHAPFWDDLQNDNVLLLSPMNVKGRHDGKSVFLPDPWAASQSPSEEVRPFYKFIRSAVGGHARTDKLNLADALGAVRFLVRHGLSVGSVTQAVTQLWNERLGNADVKWRRATILDLLLWDTFEYFWKSALSPRIGVFFSNATAHYQHKYWSHHAPSEFSLKPSVDEIRDYGHAIRYGYEAHDRLIGKALKMAEDDDTVVALCTALSQQPMRDYEQRGGKAMFMPREYPALLSFLGAPLGRAEALMAEESWLHYQSATDAEAALGMIRAARTGEGREIFKTRGFNGLSFIVGCGIFASEVMPDTAIVAADGKRAAFKTHFIQMSTVTTGKHHPDGILWVSDRRGRSPDGVQRLPLTLVRETLEQALMA